MIERKAKLRRFAISFVVVALCLYAPFGCFLLFYFSGSDRITGLKMWLFVPGCPFASNYPGYVGISIMILTNLVLFVGLSWLGSLGWRWLVIAALTALPIATFAAMVAATALAA
jgi:hypothetical protein